MAGRTRDGIVRLKAKLSRAAMFCGISGAAIMDGSDDDQLIVV